MHEVSCCPNGQAVEMIHAAKNYYAFCVGLEPHIKSPDYITWRLADDHDAAKLKILLQQDYPAASVYLTLDI